MLHLRGLAHGFVWMDLFWPFVGLSLHPFRCYCLWPEVAEGLSQEGPSGPAEGAVVEGQRESRPFPSDMALHNSQACSGILGPECSEHHQSKETNEYSFLRACERSMRAPLPVDCRVSGEAGALEPSK